MKFPGAKCRPPFVTLPRHKRSHEDIRLKGKMHRDAAEYGGRFTSRLVLNEPGRPDLYNPPSWSSYLHNAQVPEKSCPIRMGKVNLRPECIRTCPTDAALTIDAWDQS